MTDRTESCSQLSILPRDVDAIISRFVMEPEVLLNFIETPKIDPIFGRVVNICIYITITIHKLSIIFPRMKETINNNFDINKWSRFIERLKKKESCHMYAGEFTKNIVRLSVSEGALIVTVPPRNINGACITWKIDDLIIETFDKILDKLKELFLQHNQRKSQIRSSCNVQ